MTIGVFRESGDPTDVASSRVREGEQDLPRAWARTEGAARPIVSGGHEETPDAHPPDDIAEVALARPDGQPVVDAEVIL